MYDEETRISEELTGHTPSPEDIAEECRKIREEWSDRDYYIRSGGYMNWTVPELSFPDLYQR